MGHDVNQVVGHSLRKELKQTYWYRARQSTIPQKLLFSLFVDLFSELNYQIYEHGDENDESRAGSTDYNLVIDFGIVEKDVEEVIKKVLLCDIKVSFDHIPHQGCYDSQELHKIYDYPYVGHDLHLLFYLVQVFHKLEGGGLVVERVRSVHRERGPNAKII